MPLYAVSLLSLLLPFLPSFVLERDHRSYTQELVGESQKEKMASTVPAQVIHSLKKFLLGGSSVSGTVLGMAAVRLSL